MGYSVMIPYLKAGNSKTIRAGIDATTSAAQKSYHRYHCAVTLKTIPLSVECICSLYPFIVTVECIQ
jgi:hypothetical protein